MKLILKDTGKEVNPGDKIENFRGEGYTFIQLTQTHTHSPKVYAQPDSKDGFRQEFYPTVFGCEVVDE